MSSRDRAGARFPLPASLCDGAPVLRWIGLLSKSHMRAFRPGATRIYRDGVLDVRKVGVDAGRMYGKNF